MAELTNTYTQIKNTILLRNKYKILSFKPTEVDLYTYNNFFKLPINEPEANNEVPEGNTQFSYDTQVIQNGEML